MSNWGRWALPPLLLLLLTDSLEEVNLDPYFQTCKSLLPKRRRACGLTMMQVVLYSSVTTYILDLTSRGERKSTSERRRNHVSIYHTVYMLCTYCTSYSMYHTYVYLYVPWYLLRRTLHMYIFMYSYTYNVYGSGMYHTLL
jgi:hypothetical protein